MRFEIAEGVGSHSLTEIRQKTYWTSQTVTAHKDGWPSLLVVTSVQGGPVTELHQPPHHKDGRVLSGFGGKVWSTWWGGRAVGSPSNY